MIPIRELIDTWASIYANSAAIRSGVAFGHVGALLGGGGCAIAADLSTLKASRRGRASIQTELERVHGVHRIVVANLALVAVSGLLLVGADFEAYLVSTAFWIKMILVGALVINGAVLVRTSARMAEGDTAVMGRMRIVSIASLTLWFAATLMGAVLPNVL
ncbi:MAG: hypothetical protein HOP16_05730 [Acidobacteria bacterium]|nr:hypothetical protein [Acidobacteriota bacterium]